MKVTAKNNGIPIMTINAHVTNVICQGKETITAAGNSYECLVISNDTNVDSGFMKVAAKSKQWLAKGVGIVKVQNYNAAGRLVSSMVLDKVE